MSGVIDARGIQWEHCHVCGCMVRIDDLFYRKPTLRQAERINAAAKAWAESGPGRGWHPVVMEQERHMCEDCYDEANGRMDLVVARKVTKLARKLNRR